MAIAVLTAAGAETWQVAGTDLFKITRIGYFETLTDLDGQQVIPLTHMASDPPSAVYDNGLVMYCAMSEYKPGKVDARWGAVDLRGNVVVPFTHRSIKQILKTPEYKGYAMDAACREVLRNATAVSRFIPIKDRLTEYRKSRYTDEKKSISNTHYYSEMGSILRVTQNGRCALVDSRYNYITGFIFSDRLDPMYSRTYKTVAMADTAGRYAPILRLDGTVIYNAPPKIYLEYGDNGRYYYEITDKRGYSSSKNVIFNTRTECRLEELVTSMVNLNMDLWYKKDEFESRAEYAARTTPEMCRLAQEYYASAAVKLYTDLELTRPFKLGDYDRENESFLIESAVGNVAMKIPFEESIDFRKAWETGAVTIGTAKFGSTDEGVTMRSLSLKKDKYTDEYLADTFTPYTRYVMGNAQDVASPVIAVVKNPNPVDEQTIDNMLGLTTKQKVTPADVDLDIPVGKSRRDNAFALIIANENYQKLPGVAFARNDGEVLARYCSTTLGLPAGNIKTYYDATYGQMRQALKDMRNITDAYDGDVDLMVYYAGHGAPDEATSKAYLLPVDAATVSQDYCLERDAMLDEIAAMGARSAVVMFDACFTGSQRTEEAGKMLQSGRSVEIAPDDPVLPVAKTGQILVINATSGRQTAIPDRENSHGLFTYFLLKKLRESVGNVTMGDLWEYLDQSIGRRSAVLGKVQRPSIYGDYDWENLRLLTPGKR